MEVSSASSNVTPAAAAPGGGASEANKNPVSSSSLFYCTYIYSVYLHEFLIDFF